MGQVRGVRLDAGGVFHLQSLHDLHKRCHVFDTDRRRRDQLADAVWRRFVVVCLLLGSQARPWRPRAGLAGGAGR